MSRNVTGLELLLKYNLKNLSHYSFAAQKLYFNYHLHLLLHIIYMLYCDPIRIKIFAYSVSTLASHNDLFSWTAEKLPLQSPLAVLPISPLPFLRPAHMPL